MSPKKSGSKKAAPTAAEMGRKGGKKGGKSRMASLTPEERKELGRKGAEARWASSAGVEINLENLPRAVAEGTLTIGEIKFPCSVLDDPDHTRVLTETQFMEGMGMYRSGALSTRRRDEEDEGGARTPLYLAFKNLKPYVIRHLGGVHADRLLYRTMGGNVAHGIPAGLIPKICEVWLDARADKVLGVAQEKVAAKAELLLRGLAHVGIIALVDEATGYQDVRARDALARILKRYVAAELQPWVPTFKPDFYKEMFRLRRWSYIPGSLKRPGVAGYLTNDIVYRRLAPGVLSKLKEVTKKHKEEKKLLSNPKLHRGLTPNHGHPALEDHLKEVTALMRAARNWDEFIGMIDRSLPKYGETLPLPFDEKIEAEILADDEELRSPPSTST